jgi:hypothetical protein
MYVSMNICMCVGFVIPVVLGILFSTHTKNNLG